jgi:hypothetical protein
MSRTHATTRLQTVCDAIFEHAIFGLEATSKKPIGTTIWHKSSKADISGFSG